MKASTVIALLGAVVASSASADIVIESFNDQFASEAFVNGDANGLITSVYQRGALEIGYHNFADGAAIGDAWIGGTHRNQEIQNQLGLAGVFGGSRYSSFSAAPGTMGTSINAVITSGIMAYSTGSFGVHGILDLTYNANNAGLNLNVAGHSAISTELLFGDMDRSVNPRPVPMSFTLTSGLGTAGQASHTMSDFLLAEGDYSFDLAQFALNGVDLGDIDVVNFHIDQSAAHLAAVDFVIGDIAFVPAPSTAGLLVLAGITATRRRR